MICAVVLAAGRSERMGTQKLLLPLGDQPVIVRVVDELLSSPVEQVLVVVGREGERIRGALRDHAVTFVTNPDLEGDMLSSVRCGLRAVPPACEAILVALGDQPGISTALVGEMIRSFRRDDSRIVVPECDGRRGHPLLFSAQLCHEVLHQHCGHGLRGLLKAHAREVFRISVPTPSALEDMDTPEDYERQRKLFPEPVRR
jgi:molybdenum cofactor cytidylyltransferase